MELENKKTMRQKISDIIFYKFGIDNDQSYLMADTIIRDCKITDSD